MTLRNAKMRVDVKCGVGKSAITRMKFFRPKVRTIIDGLNGDIGDRNIRSAEPGS